MRMIKRLTTLLKADAHGVLDQLETRKLLAKQYLREAQIALDREQASCESMSDELRTIDREKNSIELEIEKIDQDVNLALSGGKQDLARFALRKLLQARSRLERLSKQKLSLEEKYSESQEKLAQRSEELIQLRERVRSLPENPRVLAVSQR